MFNTFFPLNLHDAHDLWYPSLSTYSKPPAVIMPMSNSTNHMNQQARSAQSQLPLRTVLNTLRADENLVAVRKAHIAGFGATWLKPPGVNKTLQGMEDERVEREEQEAAAQREIAMQEAQEAAEAQALDAEGMEDDEEGAEERNLDDDIPDGDEENGDNGDDEEWFGDGDGDANDSMDELGEGEEEEVNAMYPDDIDAEAEVPIHGGEAVVVDLDDDIPEAGSYQHTDTDVEDESSINLYDETNLHGGGMRSIPPDSSRTSWHAVPVSASSAYGSSPVVHRDAERRNDGRTGRE